MRTPLNSLNIAKPASETRVVVAMSGGVDSCVVAALLAQENYQVIGVTLQLYHHGQAARRPGACCAGPDIHDARMVADQLNIPHYVLDYEERFKKAVIEPFAESYVSGETPVPCINCNQSVKFADLLELAKSLDADILATGHYISSQWNNGRPTLHQPVDGERDQSYFLFATSPEQLKWLRFPLGDKTKSETRELAKAYGLSIADKADSQDICFVAGERYTQLIEKLRPEAVTPGDIIHIDGQILGTHQGIMHYTIGQRRGLGIASGMPLYVIRIDAKHNQVVVGPRSALQMRYVKLRDVNWLGDEPIDALIEESDFSDQSGLELYVKLRSTQKPLAARLTNFAGDWWVVLADGDQGVAAGQACVFYSSDDGNARILGGGWISQSLSDAPEIRAADQSAG